MKNKIYIENCYHPKYLTCFIHYNITDYNGIYHLKFSNKLKISNG